jgi:putative transposase
MIERNRVLTNFSEEQRREAMRKYEIIESYINSREKLNDISDKTGIPLRTLYRWAEQYNNLGLVGLIRKSRSDNGTIRINDDIKQSIEQLYIKNKKMSIATIHRKIINEHEIHSLSYYQVYKIIKNIEPSLIYLAHKGSKKYDETFNLIHIRETNRANEIWQADHTLLDIEILDESNVVNRPWLPLF